MLYSRILKYYMLHLKSQVLHIILLSLCHRESCSLYSWLNGCCKRTPAVISFNQSTVDFISGRKDPLFLSIGDNCCPSSQHSNIEVVVRQFMATTLDNLNYYIYKAQKFSRFVNGTYSVKIMYNETRCKRLKQAR